MGAVWKAGASATVEMTPSDELIPFIDEIISFCLHHFGAAPHLTIARDDRTKGIVKLTELSEKEYQKTWQVFGSDFWEYKYSIFGKRQTEFCYAGCWSYTVNLATGEARRCYYESMGNIFEDPDLPLPEEPIGNCPIAHCYNGHAFLTFGLIPGATEICYGDIRNRVKTDGTEWLQPELKAFFNSKLSESNKKWTRIQEYKFRHYNFPF